MSKCVKQCIIIGAQKRILIESVVLGCCLGEYEQSCPTSIRFAIQLLSHRVDMILVVNV